MYIKERSKPILNLLRYVKANNFGMGIESMLMLYRSLLRSVLDYGCQAFNSAPPNVKGVLDRIQAEGLKICLGALNSTPLPVLLAQSGETPLQHRRDHLSLKYYARCKRTPSNPAQNLTDQCTEYKKKYSHKWKKNDMPYGFRINQELKNHQLQDIGIIQNLPPKTAPWLLKPVTTSDKIKNMVNKQDNPHVTKNIVLQAIEDQYSQFIHVYTDGSKDPNTGKTGFAFFIPSLKTVRFRRTSDNVSVYTTEMAAIANSLAWLNGKDIKNKNIVILTDSYSSIQSIQNNSTTRPDLLQAIQNLANSLHNKGNNVVI